MKNQEEFLDKAEKGGNENDVRDKDDDNATKADDAFTDQQKVKVKYEREMKIYPYIVCGANQIQPRES